MTKLNLIIGVFVLLFAFSCSDQQNLNSPETDESSTVPLSLAKKKSIPPPPGLISWWPGDGNAYDYQGNNDGILMNGTSYEHGLVKKAFRFDWEGWDNYDADYVYIGGTSNIDNLSELTIELWVRLDSDEPSNRIERFVTIGPEGLPKAVIRHDGGNTSGQLHFFMSIDNTLEHAHVRVNDALQTGVFHHVAGTYDGSIMRVYKDGVEVGNLEISGVVNPGASYVRLSSPDEPLFGLLDEICIYDRALEPDEIKAIYDAGKWGKKPKNNN